MTGIMKERVVLLGGLGVGKRGHGEAGASRALKEVSR